MSYQEAKTKYALYNVNTDDALERLQTIPVALHCWQGDDVRGFDTDPTKPNPSPEAYKRPAATLAAPGRRRN